MNDRQQVEEFAALLEAHAAGRSEGAAGGSSSTSGTFTGSSSGLAVLAERVSVASSSLPAPRADFRERLRAQLVADTPVVAAETAAAAAAASAEAASAKQRPKSRVPAQRGGRTTRSGARHSGESKSGFAGISASWRRRLLAAGVGVAVATGSVGGIAIASAGAEPGDPLYNAKKIFENLQLSLSGSPTDQGRDYLHLADIRLGEIDALLGRPDVDMKDSPTQAYLNQTLGELRSMISNGGSLLIGQVRADDDQTALHALADFLLTERQRVADLSWRLPPVLQSQPPQIVALMDQLARQLQQTAQQAANQRGKSGTGGQQGGAGQPGQAGGGAQGTGGSANPSASGSAKSSSSAKSGGSASGSASSGASSSSSSSASASSGSTIGITVPVPVLPSIGVSIPSLLGLPAIDLGLGGDDSSSATPTQ